MTYYVHFSHSSILHSLGLLPGSPWTTVTAYCHALLSNSALRSYLSSHPVDVAIVDLVYNECGLALAHSLNVPSVGYWAFSFSSGEAEMTTVATPPSHVPAFMTELTDTMTFMERVANFGHKVKDV